MPLCAGAAGAEAVAGVPAAPAGKDRLSAHRAQQPFQGLGNSVLPADSLGIFKGAVLWARAGGVLVQVVMPKWWSHHSPVLVTRVVARRWMPRASAGREANKAHR